MFSIDKTYICNYADDTTIHAFDKNLDNVIENLDSDSNLIIQWLPDDFMKLNTDECNLMVLGKSVNQSVKINIGNSSIENTDEEKLLGVRIDDKLSFETHHKIM